jgi:hypothetical protein
VNWIVTDEKGDRAMMIQKGLGCSGGAVFAGRGLSWWVLGAFGWQYELPSLLLNKV